MTDTIFRMGTTDDFLSLDWAWTKKQRHTQKIYIENIFKGVQEFWVCEKHGTCIGELHIVWNSPDMDEADGRNRAYLCAFRVHPDYRGCGIGSSLMKRVLKRVEERGFHEVTIGVAQSDKTLKRIYNSWGFNQYLKTKTVDHHYFDEHGEPKAMSPFDLLLNQRQYLHHV